MGGVGGKEWHQIGDRPEPAAGCTTGTIEKNAIEKKTLFFSKEGEVSGGREEQDAQCATGAIKMKHIGVLRDTARAPKQTS